jgi:hypothetical protein
MQWTRWDRRYKRISTVHPQRNHITLRYGVRDAAVDLSSLSIRAKRVMDSLVADCVLNSC